MLPCKRAKQTFYVTKLHEAQVGTRVCQQYVAQEKQATMKYEAQSEDEREQDMMASTNEAFETELKMTCSDSEDSFGASTDGYSVSQSSCTNNQPSESQDVAKAKKAIPSKEPTIANVLNILTTVAEHIKEMQGKTESIQNEVANISNRLARVEKKVGISLATMEQVKDVIITADTCAGNDTPAAFSFDFKPISNEEELKECDSKLGQDEEYYNNVKKWLTVQMTYDDPDNRMHTAMDLIFDRTFLPHCSWSGHGIKAPKIPFRERTNILKLFADIGSNQYITVNELFVQKFFLKKLPHAKNRINLQSGSTTSCHNRKSTKS